MGEVPRPLVGRRRGIFHRINKYMGIRQIILLTGMRRVGKTTLMYQLIDELLRNGINPYNILYFSFDETRKNMEEIISVYETDVLKKELTGQRVFVFFDEIQKLPDWAVEVKLLYDRFPRMKLVLSGSGQIILLKDAGANLAGRYINFTLKPLNFEEYLDFKGIRIDKERENLFERELKLHLHQYMKTGGFVEALNMDEFLLGKYFKESLLERVVFMDIVDTFKIELPQVLMRLLEVFAYFPGLYLKYKNLGDDLKLDQRTISNYVSCLEYALFVQKLYNFSPNFLTSERKTKRVYLSNTAFTFALNPEISSSRIIEQMVVNMLEAKFFFRSPQKEEIDIILKGEDSVFPVEVKIRSRITKDDLKPIFRFMRKRNLQRGLVITRDFEGSFGDEVMKITAIPYWKYWTLKKKLETISGFDNLKG